MKRASIIVSLLSLAACGSDDSSGSPSSGGASSGGSSSGGSSSGGSAGTSTGGAAGTGSGGTSSGGSASGGAPPGGLSAKYPGDVGIDKDPDVVWYEGFEQADVDAVLARYDDGKKTGLALDSDVPPKSSGKQSMKMTASGAGPNAADFFKKLEPGYDELFVRYYAKYESGVQWHHTGVWIGGYNPASNWPNPQAGLKPSGDDRFNVSIEPVGGGANPRLDYYNYWMKMHSWMDSPSGSTAYWGNTLIHDAGFKVDDDQWMCIEVHIKLNPDPSSSKGAELGVWKNGQSVIQYNDATPLGYWLKDKFCPDGATAKSCTDYPPSSGTQKVPLDLQYRSTAALKINAFWPQNYITKGGAGSVYYDHMVLAKSRIGCM